MDKKAVKRFGQNNIGAKPDWIIQTRLLSKGQVVPEGYEVLTNTEHKQQLALQQEEYNNWLGSQPRPYKNLTSNQERLALTVEQNLASYKIYKYISNELAKSILDVTLPPWGIDYKISLMPKLKPVRNFEKGFLTSVVWFAWDYQNNLPIEEVLKVDIDYTLAPNTAPMPSAQSASHRVTKRQWIRQDGTYDLTERDVKETKRQYYDATETDPVKIENNQIATNKEGSRRRKNIFTKLSVQYVTLHAIFISDGAVDNSHIVSAQDIGKLLLNELSSFRSDYISDGSNLILSAIDGLSNPSYLLDQIIPEGTPYSEGWNLSLRDFMKLKIRGEI